MKNFIMKLFDELQFEMNPIICEDDNCPYQNYREELLDEHNLTVCDIIEDLHSLNEYNKSKKKESKIEYIGQTGSIFTLGQYNKEVK